MHLIHLIRKINQVTIVTNQAIKNTQNNTLRPLDITKAILKIISAIEQKLSFSCAFSNSFVFL
jgi:hypothetical protein